LTLSPITSANLTSPVTLKVSVTDDGLPKPRTPPSRPTSTQADGNIQRQTNSVTSGRPRGLTVTWLQYGGPAKVTFEPPGPVPVASGMASTQARFTVPGTYMLVVTANDGQLSQRKDLTITVAGSQQKP
jgi:hypothetical protein